MGIILLKTCAWLISHAANLHLPSSPLRPRASHHAALGKPRPSQHLPAEAARHGTIPDASSDRPLGEGQMEAISAQYSPQKAFASSRSSQSLWAIGRSNYHGWLLFGLQPPQIIRIPSAASPKVAAFRKPGPPSGPARRGGARQAAPACIDWGKAASQPTAGRAWLRPIFAILIAHQR